MVLPVLSLEGMLCAKSCVSAGLEAVGPAPKVVCLILHLGNS